MSEIHIYYGSNRIIEHPTYGVGNVFNDYGRAFYCTQSQSMAMEWACASLTDGFANEYILDDAQLKMLDLTCAQYNILNWLAILLENRQFSLKSDISKAGYNYIISNFGIEYKSFDVIKGYRADDSYFSFARAFLNNTISIGQLNRAMYLGELGEQIAIVSQLAFSKLEFQGAQTACAEIFHGRRALRDEAARMSYQRICNTFDTGGKYILDIIREGWRNEDVRI